MLITKKHPDKDRKLY